MGPNEREKAAGLPVEIDISSIEPGMLITVIWRGKPYFIRHLTKEEVAAASQAPEADFRDYAVDVPLPDGTSAATLARDDLDGFAPR